MFAVAVPRPWSGRGSLAVYPRYHVHVPWGRRRGPQGSLNDRSPLTTLPHHAQHSAMHAYISLTVGGATSITTRACKARVLALTGGHLGARNSGSSGPLQRIRPFNQEPSHAQLLIVRNCGPQGIPLHKLCRLIGLHRHLGVDKPPWHEDRCPNVVVAHLRRDPSIILTSVHRRTHCV